MGRLRVLSGKQDCTLLAEHGFVIVRQRSSHIILQRRVGNGTLTVPVPNHRELAIGTLQSIIRQSQVPRSVFETD